MRFEVPEIGGARDNADGWGTLLLYRRRLIGGHDTPSELDAKLTALEALSDEDLEMARLHLEALRLNLFYYKEGRGIVDFIDPEDVLAEGEILRGLEDVYFVQAGRILSAEAAASSEPVGQ